MKRKFGIEIRASRNAANLSLRQVADSLGRTGEWLRRIEAGILAVSGEKADRILETIARLKTIRDTAREEMNSIEPIPPRVRKDLSAALLEAVSRKTESSR